MFPKLRRFGGAALLIAASAAPGFAQEQNREKFVIAGSANKVERSDAVAEAPKGRKIAIVIAVAAYAGAAVLVGAVTKEDLAPLLRRFGRRSTQKKGE